MAQILIFKEKLPAVCERAYQQGVAQNLSITDPDNFKFMSEIPQCNEFVETGAIATADRAAQSMVLLVFVLFLAGALVMIAWPAIKGQIQVMAALAVHKLLFLAAALPGPLKAPAIMALYAAAMGCIALIILALYLSGILIAMKIVMEATSGLVMFWRLLLLLAIPFAAIGIHKRQQAASMRRKKEFQKSIERERIVSQQQKPKFNRAEQFVVDNMKYEGAKKVVTGIKNRVSPKGGPIPADHKEEAAGATTAAESGVAAASSARQNTSRPTAPNTAPQYEYKYAETSQSGSNDELRRNGYYKNRTVPQEDILGTATPVNGNGNGHRKVHIPDPPEREPSESGLVKGSLDAQTPVHPDEYGKQADAATQKARQQHLARMAERNRNLREKLNSD
jgi:hypothetical protein